MFYTPTPKEIREARIASDLTQKACADMCLVTVNSWARYEQGKMQMSPPIWELFIMKVAQLSLQANVTGKSKDPNALTPEEKKLFDDMLANWDEEALKIEAKNYAYRDGRPVL